MCILYLIVYDFNRFRCAENRTPQEHFRFAIALACLTRQDLLQSPPEYTRGDAIPESSSVGHHGKVIVRPDPFLCP